MSGKNGVVEMPAPLLTLVVPKRIERVQLGECDPVYEGLWCDLWTNPSDALVSGERTGSHYYPFLASIIAGWNLEMSDGTPADVTAEAMHALPTDVLLWVGRQWSEKQQLPLLRAASSKPPTGDTETEAFPRPG